MDVDLKKLEAFAEAAISNTNHPVYKIGWKQSDALRFYALNVSTLRALTPEQYFKDYPKWTAQLAEAMAYLENEQAAQLAETAKTEKTAADVKAMEDKITELTAKIAALSETPKPVTEGGPSVAARDAAGMDSSGPSGMASTDGTAGDGKADHTDGQGEDTKPGSADEEAPVEVTCPSCGAKFKVSG